jgi:DNA-binding beta-propeller fold protein YncE
MKSTLIAILASALCAAAVAADQEVPAGATGPYDYVANWLKPVAPGRWIYPLTVEAQSPDRIFIGIGGTSLPQDPNVKYDGDSWRKEFPDARQDHKVFVVDRTGKVIENWSQWDEKIQWPHRIRINPYDPQKHVWVVDRASQQIFEFTNDGKKIVMTLGERGVAGSDSTHFGRPTDIAWLPDGTFFVSDGYDNARVVKFDKTGRYLLSWGTKGSGPGQFNLVHGVTVGPDREVWVVDRDNNRVQVFDENGRFLRQFPTKGRPTTLIVDAQKNSWVLEGTPGGLLGKHDLAGKYLYSWGVHEKVPGGLMSPHDMSTDATGAIYFSQSPVQRVDKFVPKAGADKSLLVGARYHE